MKRIYLAFLNLYPRDYREAFSAEILTVFEDAADEHRSRGRAIYARFLLSELFGALTGAASQWAAKLAPPPLARAFCPNAATDAGYRSPIREAEMRIEFSIGRMTQAIATHDFIAARAWSFEEIKAREELRRLRDR